MESQQKLSRTSSSLLRTPTVHSSIQSLDAVDELDLTSPDHDETKKTHRPVASSRPLLVLLLLLLSTSVLAFLVFLRVKSEVSISGNLALWVGAVCIACLAAKRCRLCGFSGLRYGRRGSSVEWFIGDEEEGVERMREKGEEGEAVWDGVELYGNGDCYEGELYKGRCNGSGVYNYFGSGRYEGDWVDGKYDGHGIESWARGSRYRGQYQQGLRHGFGTYRFYTGDSYSGQWFNGQSHGMGVQSCSDGSCYVGQFKFGLKHGLGYYNFRNGDRYSGEYFADKIHGFGIYHFVNGHCYEGSWHEGRRQGFGAYTFRNGAARSGEWDCGVLKTPHPPGSAPVQRATKAARETELNAVSLPRLDEQVEKAIAAANQAAAVARAAATRAVQKQINMTTNCGPNS